MARAVRPARGVAGLAALTVAVAWAVAQPPARDSLPVPEGGTTLYLVVRTKPSVEDERVIKTINAGLESSLHTIDGRPVIKSVSPLFFEQFAELIGSATSAPPAATPAGKVGIAPLPSREAGLQELRLPSAKQTLTKLTVSYTPVSGKPDTEEYAPKQPGDGPLTLIEPGRYSFRPAAGRAPSEYTATVDERDDTTKQLVRGKEIKGTWPESDKFYVVTLKNFRRTDGGRHNHERFLSTIERQNQNTANPIQISRLGGDQLFVFADMAARSARVGSLVVGNELQLRIPDTERRNGRRAWVLFPLTESEYTDAVKKYSSFPTAKLPAEIRANASTVNDNLTVDPDTKPRWIEVPPDGTTPFVFSRSIPLRNLPGLATKYPNVWQLTVWEFERPDGTDREAISVQNADGKDVSALGYQIANWATELKRAVPK